METFPALLAICVGNSPVTGEFPAQRPVRRSFDVFFDLRLNKRLSKQWRGWWFETPSHPVWRHCNVIAVAQSSKKDFPEKGISATYEKYPSRNSTSWIHTHLTYSRKKKFQLAVWEKQTWNTIPGRNPLRRWFILGVLQHNSPKAMRLFSHTTHTTGAAI